MGITNTKSTTESVAKPKKRQNKRIDRINNERKIKRCLAKNPLLTEPEVAKKLGVGRSTVWRVRKDLKIVETHGPNLSDITKKDKEIISIAQELVLGSLMNVKKKVDAGTPLELHDAVEVSRLGKDSFGRVLIFEKGELGDATDKEITIKIEL